MKKPNWQQALGFVLILVGIKNLSEAATWGVPFSAEFLGQVMKTCSMLGGGYYLYARSEKPKL
jgi:hypothetical protein